MKKILGATVLSVVLVLAASPAQAGTNESNSNPLSGITDWLNQAKESVEKYAQVLKEPHRKHGGGS